MLSRHPKLVSRGSEVADADLKFKGAPSDDCDPFAIQNYIDRIAAELFDTLNAPRITEEKGKDEWELMKEKAKSVPYKEVSLSIALKHGLMEEVKKENANKTFEKESILTIMKVRDEFLQDYPNANSFQYQWQIWVEWERYLKQIGVTIPQWGKIARKLIRLGVQMIQEDMTKKYSQISAANKRKSEDLGTPQSHERRRKTSMPTLPIIPDGAALPSYVGTGFNAFISSHHAYPAGGFSDMSHMPFAPPSFIGTSPMTSPANSPRGMYVSPATSPRGLTSPAAMSPASMSPVATSPQFGAPSTFGASLYNMIASATSPHGLFSSPSPSLSSANSACSPSSSCHPSPAPSPSPSPIICFDAVPYPDVAMPPPALTPPVQGSSLLPYPYSEHGYVTSSTSLPTVMQHSFVPPTVPPLNLPPHSPYTSPAPSPHPMVQFSPPPSPSPPSSMSNSPSMYSPLSMAPSSMVASPQYTFVAEGGGGVATYALN